MKLQAYPRALLWLIISCLHYGQAQSPLQTKSIDLSIAERTASSKEHTTLLAAVQAANMEETLNNDGPYTIFAPSDEAFEQWSPEKTAALLKPENIKELQAVVTYHIIAGKFSAAKILKALCSGEGTTSFTTVQGDEIIATMDGIDIVLTDEHGTSARITVADSNQCNGVIHVIDRVILPKPL